MLTKSTKIAALAVTSDLTLYHVGPPLDYGPLPSLFYFALSGPDSLGLDPFNQPVQFLRGKMIRVFSLTLPAHENGLSPKKALQTWAEEYARGMDPLGAFLDQCTMALAFALHNHFVNPEKLAIAGLSRGGLLAFHLAARDPRLRSVLAFAPITKLSQMEEFAASSVSTFDAERLAPTLSDRHVRLYIGNCDTRVGTQSCFEFAMALVDAALERNLRTPQIECFITPSIGKDGHGTSPEIFRQGAEWIATFLS